MNLRNPYEKTSKGASEYLDPRNSFKRWVETIEGTSREWSEDQGKIRLAKRKNSSLTESSVETASLLGMLYSQYGRFKLAETPENHVQAVDETFHLSNTGESIANICKSVLISLSVKIEGNFAKGSTSKESRSDNVSLGRITRLGQRRSRSTKTIDHLLYKQRLQRFDQC